jgi:hypothetical protein
VKHQNDPKDMHYLNEGNVDVNMVGHDICILSLGYCITLMKIMHGYDIVNVSIGYCIVQLDDMKYNLGMKVLHKSKIIW